MNDLSRPPDPNASPRRRRLGELLVADGAISARDAEDAIDRAAPGERLGATLLRLGMVTDAELADAVATQLRLPRIDLTREHVDLDAVARLPERLADRYDVLPLGLDGQTLRVAISDPSDVAALDGVRLAAGVKAVQPVVTTAGPLTAARRRAYRAAATNDLLWDLGGERGSAMTPPPTRADAIDDGTPIAQLVEALVADALAARASDIHLEPDRDGLRVRLRVDGDLRESTRIPEARAAPLRSRLKLLAQLDIAERRLPQDGRGLVRVGARDQDLRVSVMPTLHGETLVLRLLPRRQDLLDLDVLGFAEREYTALTRTLRRPQGLVLLTGPTGSGKTTTAYASLAAVGPQRRNILTLEDPIEVEWLGVNQTQVDPTIGLTFAHGLRHVLRQDPDVLLVGEIRDRETAELTVEAASTGHLVIATVHTNDAPSAVSRLADLGADRFLLASALELVIAQRLVRRICEGCAEPAEVAADVRLELGLGDEPDRWIGARQGRGCDRCDGTGIHGRDAVAESLVVEPEVRELLLGGAGDARLARTAMASGLRSLRADAVDRATAGQITFEEALRGTPTPLVAPPVPDGP